MTIDPLFFSQACSDARICLRTGPVCMCGIERMKARLEAAEAVCETYAENYMDEEMPWWMLDKFKVWRRLKDGPAPTEG